jgi:hypothetical protein
VGKKIFLPLNFLAKKEVSYSPFHSLARWRSVATAPILLPMNSPFAGEVSQEKAIPSFHLCGYPASRGAKTSDFMHVVRHAPSGGFVPS